jgi:two-component system, OmpR family, sensor histidine kinase BaeS
VKLEPNLPEVNPDPVRMEQALSNLVSNVLRYTPQGGKNQLSAKQESGSLTVSVEDNGSGIPADILHHIFERSFRDDESRNVDATGLGLAIAKSIMELHGGKIHAESDGAGSYLYRTFESSNDKVS